MRKILLSCLLLVSIVSISTAQYRGSSYRGSSYGYGHSYGYGYQRYYAPSYYGYQSYYAPSYYAPSYTWYGAMNYGGRWFPAGYYAYDGSSWLLKGYGAFNGYESPPASQPKNETSPPPVNSGLSPEDVKKLKEILKGLSKEK